MEMMPASSVPGNLDGADHATDSESPSITLASGPAVPGPTGCQSTPGMPQRIHQPIRRVGTGMPDRERSKQDLMADAVPEPVIPEPLQTPRQLFHPLGRYQL